MIIRSLYLQAFRGSSTETAVILAVKDSPSTDPFDPFAPTSQALYYCDNRSNGLNSSLSRAYDTRNRLDRLFRDEASICEILRAMSKTINEISTSNLREVTPPRC
jgi:hypothetical protein